jgi:hypothetical protein
MFEGLGSSMPRNRKHLLSPSWVKPSYAKRIFFTLPFTNRLLTKAVAVFPSENDDEQNAAEAVRSNISPFHDVSGTSLTGLVDRKPGKSSLNRIKASERERSGSSDATEYPSLLFLFRSRTIRLGSTCHTAGTPFL